jgi:hypothetical protein
MIAAHHGKGSMKRIRIAAIGVVAGLTLALTGVVPAIDAVQTADARNPHCAGNSDNFKRPNDGVVQNFPACD